VASLISVISVVAYLLILLLADVPKFSATDAGLLLAVPAFQRCGSIYRVRNSFSCYAI
jgi:hypothetical protein